MDFPASSGHHHPGDEHRALVPGQLPGAPPGATAPAIEYSLAGMLGRGLELVFAPIGFNWQISIALVPGMAAREVVVGALGTVYALSGQRRGREPPAADAAGRPVVAGHRPCRCWSGSCLRRSACPRWPWCARETQRLEACLDHAGLHVRVGLCRQLHHLRLALALAAGRRIAMWQDLIVGVIVVLAAALAVWRLMPGRWRERLGGQAGGCGSSTGGTSGRCPPRAVPAVAVPTEPLC